MPTADRLVERLAELVSFDTRNPDGDEGPLVRRLAAELRTLGAASVDEVASAITPTCTRASAAIAPRVLLNAHVDTVPANEGYTSPPHLLVRRGDRLYGLGTADIKGAVAAILEALAAGPITRPVGVLFSGDEEHGGGCIRAFLDSGAARGLERAIVCEPTRCRVGVRHRGIGAATVTLEAEGGHSSRVDEMVNPIAVLARAAVALDDMGIEYRSKGPPGFKGINLNVAALDGGIAFNVIPTRATLTLSVRQAPGDRVEDLLAEAERRVRAATSPHAVAWAVTIASPSLQPRDITGFRAAAGRARRRHRRSRVLDRGVAPVRAGDRRGRVRSRRHRAGARRRRVRRDRRAGDGPGRVRARAAVMETDIIQRFLESVGAKADIDLYLRLHRAQRKESFAMLAPNAQIVKGALDPLHFDLRILAGLGLLPVVVLGLLEPKDADAQATRVLEWLVEDAVPCEVVRATADALAGAETIAAIRAIVARGALPLVSLEATKELSIEARFGTLASLVATLETRKLVFLSRRPGLAANGGSILPVVSLATDTQRLLAPGVLPRGQAMLLRQVKKSSSRCRSDSASRS